MHLGTYEAEHGEPSVATGHFRQVAAAYETAQASNVSSNAAVRGLYQSAVDGLIRVGARSSREAVADELATSLQRASVQPLSPGAAASGNASRALPACAGCGAAGPLKKCKGSCKGKGPEGKFCSPECFSRSWKAHKKNTGCRNLARGEAGDGAAAS